MFSHVAGDGRYEVYAVYVVVCGRTAVMGADITELFFLLSSFGGEDTIGTYISCRTGKHRARDTGS